MEYSTSFPDSFSSAFDKKSQKRQSKESLGVEDTIDVKQKGEKG